MSIARNSIDSDGPKGFKFPSAGSSLQGNPATRSRTDETDETSLDTPRSIQTKDEYDDPEINDILDPTQKEATTLIGAVNNFFQKQAKAFVRNFVDYGPPYTRKPFDASLVNECSKPVMNHRELHKLLNNRLDPNIPDPEDLYYYPIHWCARNIHFMAMKMLMRAGAKVNVTNELGCSPLDMCAMMKLPPDKRGDQLKMMKYLLERGANPNNRDKGGFSAIDQAAINQDKEIILLLLEYGANVLRDNHTLVAKRTHILRNVRTVFNLNV
jgi:ankyrin repeat protein